MTTLLGELVRRSELSDRRVDDLVIPEMSPDLISPFLALTGLRGFWPMSAFASGGNAFDQSGNGRTLTYNGNPTYNYDGVAPYIDFDGTGDFLSRADEAGLDILGTEAYVAAAVRGLTMGGWFWADVAQVQGLTTKGTGVVAASAYALFLRATSTEFRVSDGAAFSIAILAGAPPTGEWMFIVGRYDASAPDVTVFRNSQSATVAGPAAPLNNSASSLIVGGFDGGVPPVAPLDGRASLCFLCAAALSDTIIDSVFQQTRAAYRV